jgi:hypothetical protein
VCLVEHYSISEPTLEVWVRHRKNIIRTAIGRIAFTQTITQGANIRFNSMTMEVAGNNLTDDHHTL